MFDHDLATGKALLDVLKGDEAWRRPIWFMRQAGRYLPEYRKVRAQAGSFLDLCFDPELASEVTLQPLKRFDLDAAILFADILLLPKALGQNLEFRANEGPVLEAIRDQDGLKALSNKNFVDELKPVFETVDRVKAALPNHVALIGFCGAPWTVATYMIEGGTSVDRGFSRIAAHRDDEWLNVIIDRLVDCSIVYLCEQIKAGAEAVQIFDTWAGDLPDGLCERYCFEPINRIVDGVKSIYPDVPVIGFARGIGVRQLDFAMNSGVDAIGVEWSFPVERAARELIPQTVVQGNIDPLCLLAGSDVIRDNVLNVVSKLDKNRHIMNLGHGIKPETPPESIARVVECVREFDGRV